MYFQVLDMMELNVIVLLKHAIFLYFTILLYHLALFSYVLQIFPGASSPFLQHLLLIQTIL